MQVGAHVRLRRFASCDSAGPGEVGFVHQVLVMSGKASVGEAEGVKDVAPLARASRSNITCKTCKTPEARMLCPNIQVSFCFGIK